MFASGIREGGKGGVKLGAVRTEDQTQEVSLPRVNRKPRVRVIREIVVLEVEDSYRLAIRGFCTSPSVIENCQIALIRTQSGRNRKTVGGLRCAGRPVQQHLA